MCCAARKRGRGCWRGFFWGGKGGIVFFLFFCRVGPVVPQTSPWVWLTFNTRGDPPGGKAVVKQTRLLTGCGFYVCLHVSSLSFLSLALSLCSFPNSSTVEKQENQSCQAQSKPLLIWLFFVKTADSEQTYCSPPGLKATVCWSDFLAEVLVSGVNFQQPPALRKPVWWMSKLLHFAKASRNLYC